MTSGMARLIRACSATSASPSARSSSSCTARAMRPVVSAWARAADFVRRCGRVGTGAATGEGDTAGAGAGAGGFVVGALAAWGSAAGEVAAGGWHRAPACSGRPSVDWKSVTTPQRTHGPGSPRTARPSGSHAVWAVKSGAGAADAELAPSGARGGVGAGWIWARPSSNRRYRARPGGCGSVVPSSQLAMV